MARPPSYRQESINTQLAREAAERAVDRRNAARDLGFGSAPHSAAETAGGVSTPSQWASRNAASPNMAALHAGVLSPYTLPAAPQGPTPSDAPMEPTNVPHGTINPYPQPGTEGIAHPPPMDNLTGSWNKGTTIPDRATNYLGEKTYFSPYAQSNVHEIDPAKDQRFAVMGQTSGAQTAQGILDKYGTPGTTASFTPGTVTDAAGNVAQNGQTVFNRQQSETALRASHPEIFQARTPQNAAFVAHAQQFGEPSAHANVDTIMSNAAKPAAAPTPAEKPIGEQMPPAGKGWAGIAPY
jgi:hypothetical protein